MQRSLCVVTDSIASQTAGTAMGDSDPAVGVEKVATVDASLGVCRHFSVGARRGRGDNAGRGEDAARTRWGSCAQESGGETVGTNGSIVAPVRVRGCLRVLG
eukprot:6460782-Prymnesium_polylepis.1